jgi:ferredoxin
VNAIYPADELPAGQERFLSLNAVLARQWPVIDSRKNPPPDADEWAKVMDKLNYLER